MVKVAKKTVAKKKVSKNEVAKKKMTDRSTDVSAYEEFEVGMSASYAKTVTDADIVLFAGISGDINPVHLNQEFAADTMFEGRIAHGLLTASFISTVLGVMLPGPGGIYLRQELNFKAPVRAGDTVNAQVTITELIPEKRRVILETVCTVEDKVVLNGMAHVYIPPEKTQ